MVKQSNSNTQIVRQGKPSSLDLSKSEDQLKRETVKEYIDKFALIQGRGVTDALYATYYEAISDLPLKKIVKGFAAYLREGERWPWPGTLREYMEDEI